MSTEALATSNLPRPPRGSGTGPSRARGRARGGYSASRGGVGAAPKATQESSDWAAQEDPSSADTTEEIAQLKIKYSIQLKSLKEIFPDWTAEDLVYTLQEADGDIELATDRIAGGHATQWGQVKRKSLKEKTKSTGRAEGAPTGTRGRGRGTERGAERGSRGRGEGRGTRGRGRGEARGRGRGAAPVSTDATSTAATIASDETPSTWPDAPSADDTTVTETDSKDVNGVNGTQTHEEPAPAKLSAWGIETKAPVVDQQPSPVSSAPPQKSTPSAAASRQSRIVDPKAKHSWASIVKPVAPPPAPKPAPVSQPPPQPHQKPAQQPDPQASSGSRPSTRGHDMSEEPAQTIHDPFTAAEPAKPKVQLPQPALPYIPALPSQPKEQLQHSEPLTSRNLDLLEDQQSPVPQPPTPSVAAHRASPAPKNEGPPGLNTRFARNSRDTPVIMPGLASQPIGAMQLQFGSIDLNQESEVKPEEPKEESLLPAQPQELEAPQQPTPSQPRASPAVQPPQPAPVQPQSQRIPSIPGQGPPAFQQPAAFGGLIPGQAQRYSGPAAPGLTQSKDFSGFPYDQHYQGQSGSGYGDYIYGAGGQGQYDMSPRDYYYYQQQQQRAPPSTAEQTRPAAQSSTPSATETTTPSQFSSATPASGPASTQPTPTPSTQSQHQPQHPQQYPGMHPYWTNPYYANQMYQQHYGGYPYYNQGHKGMYQGQGYGGSQYGGQQGGYDRFSSRDQGGYDAFSRMNYSGTQGQQGNSSQGMQQHGSQQAQTSNDDNQPTESAPTPTQSSSQGQGAGYSGYQGSSQSRLPYGLGPQSGSTGSQQGYQQHYPQNAQQNHGYTGYNNPSYNSTGNNNPSSTSQSQSNTQNTRGQSGWGQPYGSH